MSILKTFSYVVVFGLISSAAIANPPDFMPRTSMIEVSEASVIVRK